MSTQQQERPGHGTVHYGRHTNVDGKCPTCRIHWPCRTAVQIAERAGRSRGGEEKAR